MKLLILAAGKGTRISQHIPDIPKCMVDIGDISLIKYSIRLFKQMGIDDIGIVLGYKYDKLKQEINGENVEVYFNPFYDVTNSIASIWFARGFFQGKDDILIMNGDVFLETALMDQILSASLSPVLFADGSRKENADYKFYWENNILLKHGKELRDQDITGEYVGIARINNNFMSTFLAQLDKMICEQKHYCWWENVLYELINEREIHVQDIQGSFWSEVDTIEDYQRILKFRKIVLEEPTDISAAV